MLARTKSLKIALWLSALLAVSLTTFCRDIEDDAPQFRRQADAALKRGDLAEAERLASQGFEDWEGQPETRWHWEFRLLLSEVFLQKRELEEAALWLGDQVPPGAEFDDLRCQRLLNQFRICMQEKDPDLRSAYRLLVEAEHLAARLGSASSLAHIETRKGYWHLAKARSSSDKDRPAEDEAAKRHFEAAVRKAKEAHDPYWEGTARGSLGFFLMHRLRFAEAIAQFEAALMASRQAGDEKSVQRIAGNMGWCYARLGNLEMALQLLKSAELSAADIGLETDRERWLGNRGSVLYEQGEHKDAVSAFNTAAAMAHDLGDTRFEGIWLSNLATAMIQQGGWEAAEDYNRRALELKKDLPEEQRRESVLYSKLNTAYIEIGRHHDDKAAKTLQSILDTPTDDPLPHWEARAALAEIFARKGDDRKAEEYFQAALKSFDEARASLRNRDRGLIITFQERRQGYLESYVDFLMRIDKPEKALQVVESSRAQVLAEGLGRESVKLDNTAPLQEMAKKLNAVLLSYWIAPGRSFLWAVTADGIQAFELPGRKEIEEKVTLYEPVLMNRDPLIDSHWASEWLYDNLLGHLEGILRPGGRVVLVPHGILNNLNFETLLVPKPRRHYWIEDAVLALAPSLATLKPDTDSKQDRNSYLLISYSPPESPIPEADNEISKIDDALRLHGLRPSLFSKSDAHSKLFEELSLQDYQLIHFAAHAVPNRESPLNSYVTLHDKLYAHAVASTKLSARLVTVSACQSAGAQSYAGEGLVGFTWAFLYAGAHNVVAGLWNVSDRSSSKLMEEFYVNLGTGMDIASALRQAKLNMLGSDGPRSRPYHWAPFQIYTHSSPFESLFEPLDPVESAEGIGH